MDSTYLGRAGRRPRLSGAVVGFAIAAAASVMQPLDGSGAGLASGLFGIGALVAGTLGGFAFGRTAARATNGGTWLGIIFGLAGFAVLVGAFAVTWPMAVTASASVTAPTALLVEVALRWAALALLGALILGLPALLITLPAAAVWAAVMAVLIGQGRDRTAQLP